MVMAKYFQTNTSSLIREIIAILKSEWNQNFFIVRVKVKSALFYLSAFFESYVLILFLV